MGRKNRGTKNKREEREERSFTPASPLRAKTDLQGEYIRAVQSYPIVIATGFPGTGKTYIAARLAAAAFKKGEIKTIVLSRPNVSASSSLGFFKGTKDEKMMQWLAPVIGALREEMSPGEINYCIKEGVERINFCPLEVIKGISWKNSFVILDEAEDCTFKELRSILTRIGKNTTLVLSGDTDQCDLDHSGLSEILRIRDSDPALQNIIAHIDFNDTDDIVRSETCKQVVVSLAQHCIV